MFLVGPLAWGQHQAMADTVCRTTNTVYGTTFTEAGVGIGLEEGIQKFNKKRPLISRT